MKQKLYTIQEAATILEVSANTLRRWEESGIIKPFRTLGNQRRYRDEDIKRLLRRKHLNAVKQQLKEEVSQPLLTPKQEALPTPPQENTPVIKAAIIPEYVNEPAPVVIPPSEPVTITSARRRFSLKGFLIPAIGAISAIAILVCGIMLWQIAGYPGRYLGATAKRTIAQDLHAGTQPKAVLAATTSAPAYQLAINVPTLFGKKVTFLDSVEIKKSLTVAGLSILNGGVKTNNADVNAGTGKLTASNVVYSVKAGSNISITGDKQNPTISANAPAFPTIPVTSVQGATGAIVFTNGAGIGLNGTEISNTGVLSVQGQKGDVSFTGGTGISLSGTTITNSDPGSAQNIFKTFTVGATDIVASSNTDTLTFAAGSGITLSGNSGTKTITITGTGGGGLTGLTPNGVLYATSVTDATTTTPGTNGQVLHGVTGGAPVFSAVNLTTDVTGTLPFGNGGTGVTGTPTNGQLLIGNGSGFQLSTLTAGNAGIGIGNGSGTITLSNNGVLSLTGTASQVLVNGTSGSAQTGALTLTLPQDIAHASTPQFTSLTLTAATNQLTLGSGNTGTITTAALGAPQTYTFPNASGTVCLTIGNCAGSGGGITGSGTINYLAKFDSSGSIASSSIFDNGKVGIGTASPQGLFSVSGAVPGLGLVSLNETGNQDIFSASASGVTQFAINHNGDLQFTGGSGFLQTLTSSAANAKTYNFPTFSGSLADICLSSGNCSGVGGVIGGTGTTNFISKFTPDGTHIGNSLLFDNGLSLGVNTTTPGGFFDVEGGLTGKALGVFNEIGDQSILTGSVSGATKFVFDNAGNLNLTNGSYQIGGASVLNSTTLGGSVINSSLTSVGTITSGIWHGSVVGTQYGGTGNDWSGIATGSLPYFSGTGAMSTIGIGAAGSVLTVSGGIPTWTASSSLNFWQRANGAIAPLNLTDDLLLGSTATGSAKFAFMNVAGGTPIASISATSSGTGLALGGDGTIQSLRNNTLVVGGTTTGDIQFKPGNASTSLYLASNGNVGINTTTPNTQLEVNGALRLSGTGTDTFITPNGGTVQTKINIPVFSPGGFGQVLALGIPSTSPSNARVISVFDGRDIGVGAHQPSIGVFDPGQNDMVGFSWEGTSGGGATGYVKTLSGNLGFRVNNTVDAMTLLNTGFVGINNTNPIATLDIHGNSGTTPVASISGRTAAAGLLVDNGGPGDIFTASQGGITRFVISPTGKLQFTGNTGTLSTIDMESSISTPQTYTFPNSTGKVCLDSGNCAGVGGNGDVNGPGSSTDNALVRFDGITGRLIQNSGIIIDDSNNVSGVNSLAIAPASNITGLTLTGTNVTSGNLAYLNANNTSGTISNIAYGSPQTLTGSLIGQAIDLNNGQVTATNQNVTGQKITLPTITNTNGAGTENLLGLQVGFGSGAGINQNGAGATIFSNLDVQLPALTQTSGTLTANGLAVTTPSSITTGGTANGVFISPTGVGAGNLNGVKIGSITGGAGTETALNIGSGWDNVLSVNGNAVINGSGVALPTGGGTGISSYTTGDLIYANGTNTLATLAGGAGNNGKVLTISGGVPVWGTSSGASCTDCVINDPANSTTNTIAPTGAGTTGLIVKQTSTISPTQDIFDITDSTGSTVYFKVDKDGNVFPSTSIGNTLTLTPTTDTTALTLVGTNVPTASLQYINAKNQSGKIFNLNYGAAQTLSTSLSTTGIAVDLSNNVTANNAAAVTGESLILPAETNTNTSGTKLLTGLSITGGTLNQNGAGGTTTYAALDATIPALTQTAGTLNGYGLNVTTPSSITTGGTAAALNVNASGISSGTLYGLNISSITGGAGTETAINIGSGWDNILKVNGTTVVDGSGNVNISNVIGNLPTANGGSPFTEGSGAIFERNTTEDLLLGATSTSSAKFAFMNVNSGTPTASISGASNNATSLTATGVLGTTNAQTLALGTAATGNIVIGGGSGVTQLTNNSISLTGTAPIISSTNALQLNTGANTLTLNQGGAGQVQFFGASNFITSAGALTLAGTGNALNLSGAGANINFSGAGTAQIITASNQNLALMPTGTGDVGVNVSSNLLATLDVRGNSGTTAVASVSGTTAFASMVIDNRGSGDLFAASTGGVPRFTIQNNGTLVDTHYNTVAGVFYGTGTGALTQTGTGSSGQVLQLVGSTPTWVDAGAAGISYWQRNAGAISPFAISDDLLLGGIATNSAKFAFTGNAGSLTPVASIAATPSSGTTNGLSMSGTGTIQSLNNNTLTLGGATTGNITISPNNGGGLLTMNGLIVANGTLAAGVNNTNVNLLTANIAPSGGFSGGTELLTNLQSTTNNNTAIFGTVNEALYSSGTTNYTGDVIAAANQTLLTGGSGNFTRIIGNLGKANVQAGYSGTVTTAIGQMGVIQDDGTGLNSGSGYDFYGGDSQGTTHPGNLYGLYLENLSGGTTANYEIYVAGGTSYFGGKVGVGNTSPLATLDVRGLSGTIPVASVSGSTSFASLVVDNSGVGDLFSASKSGASKFTVNNAGNIIAPNYAGSNAVLYGTTGTGLFATATTINQTQCLLSGVSAPTWGSCDLGTTSWAQSAGAIYPGNSTEDLLVGGTSTASAKFAFINVNNGTPTASISGASNNATSLSATGVLATTNAQTLTLGSASTGNVQLSPGGAGQIVMTGDFDSGVTIGTQATTAFPLLVNNGIGSNAAFAVNQKNSGDLFVASASGTTRFQIANTGRVNVLGGLASDIDTLSGTSLTIGGTTATSMVFGNSTTNPSFAFNGNGSFSVAGGGANNITLGSSTGNGTVVIQPNAGGQASLIVKNQGSGDLLTASAGATTKFIVDNSGNISFAGGQSSLLKLQFTAGGAQTITFPNATGTVCLTTNNCATTNYWQLNAGALSPFSNTADLLVGGTSTASAKFAFMNNATGSPTASISGNFSIVVPSGATPAEQINILNGGSLDFRTSVGGDGGSSISNLKIANTGITANGTLANGVNNTSVNKFTATLGPSTGLVGANDFETVLTSTGSSDAGIWGQLNQVAYNAGQTGSYTGDISGLLNQVNLQGGSGTFNHTFGAINKVVLADHSNYTGTVTGAYGTYSRIDDSNSTALSSGSVYDFYAADAINGGGIGTEYGLYLENMQAATTNYSIYSNGGKSYFAGNIGVGSGNTSPLATLDVRTNSGTLPVASISGKTSYAGLIVDNSGVGDIFTASSSGLARFTVKQSGVVQIGNSTDGLTFDYLNGTTAYVGGARLAKQIVLSPEYSGAVLTASGSAAIIGNMTSDASPSANFRNYYQWSASGGSLEQYTIAVRTTLPKDFSAWATSNAITADIYTNLKNNGSNKIDILAYKAGDGSVVVYDQAISDVSADKTWTTRTYPSSAVQTLTAGDTIVFYITLYSKNNMDAMVGDITLNYLAKF